jgi:glycosyltransferase involved in cell wall biosynthesis
MARATWSEVRRFRPDLVLSNSIEVPPNGVPTACIVHDLNFGHLNSDDLETRLRRSFYSQRLRRVGRVVTPSSATARAIRELGISEDQIRVIHNGVDFGHFCPPETLPDRTDGRIQFVFPSRVLPGKGQHHAIDAIARLHSRLKKRVHLTIVGAVVDSVYLDQLRVQAYDQPVDFALNVDDMAPHYQRADVVMFPSELVEGFGYTAIEGMACGKPVIWFDQPAVREATGGLGIPVPMGDVDGLRRAVIRLVEDPSERERLGRQGREYVETHLAWCRVWQRYETVLGGMVR